MNSGEFNAIYARFQTESPEVVTKIKALGDLLLK